MLTAASAAAAATASVPNKTTTRTTSVARRVSEMIWRKAAEDHQNHIHELLQPGLTMTDSTTTHVVPNSGNNRPYCRHRHHHNHEASTRRWTALDPKHPVYNFLIEYYGLKGVKGVK
jgi:hypothetical protein